MITVLIDIYIQMPKMLFNRLLNNTIANIDIIAYPNSNNLNSGNIYFIFDWFCNR